MATLFARQKRASFGVINAEPVVRNIIVNTVLSTPVDEHNYTHPPSSLETVASPHTVSLADRVALHVGLALITWSRRPRTTFPNSGEHLRARRQAAIERANREREWQLALYLSQSRR